jgi:hypothetical protein
MTVGHPITMLPPCAVLSPILAAGMLPIITVPDPATIVSGGPAQVHISPTLAAGIFAIITVGHPAGRIGPPTCGVGTGVCIGQVCMSPTLAAIGISYSLRFTVYSLRFLVSGFWFLVSGFWFLVILGC